MANKRLDDKFGMTLPEKMEMVKQSIRAVTRGYKTSRLITGVPGIGKSKAILDELEYEEVNYVHVSGGIKDARTFYMYLFDHNDEDMILFFDDVNQIFSDKDSREILRVAVTNEPRRQILFTDNVLAKKKKQYPTPFEFKSRIIICTNTIKKKIDPAILSRTMAIEIIVDKKEIFKYIGNNLEGAPPHGVATTLEAKQKVYTYIEKEIGVRYLKWIDFRVFEDCVIWFLADEVGTEWKKHVYEIVT